MSHQPHIVILGTGFGAIAAARSLRRLLPNAHIRLIAPRPELVYLPSLIWIPIGLRKEADLIMPLSGLLARHGLDFTPAHAVGLADGGRTVVTDRGLIRNDGLVIATGAHFLRDLPGDEQTLCLCEGPAAASAVRRHLRRLDRGRIALGCGTNPLEPNAMRPGPTFELAFGIDTWLRRQKRRERFDLVVFSALDEPAARLGYSAVSRIHAELRRRDIEMRFGSPISRFDAAGVHTSDGLIAADMTVYTPGLCGPEWVSNAGLPVSPGGFVAADEYCAVPGMDRVFAAGDVGSFPGPTWSPKLAHMAQLQATVCAANLHAALQGLGPPERLRHELLYVIDTLDAGMFVHRTESHAISMTPHMPLHWAKRAVERRYLSGIRSP